MKTIGGKSAKEYIMNACLMAGQDTTKIGMHHCGKRLLEYKRQINFQGHQCRHI